MHGPGQWPDEVHGHLFKRGLYQGQGTQRGSHWSVIDTLLTVRAAEGLVVLGNIGPEEPG